MRRLFRLVLGHENDYQSSPVTQLRSSFSSSFDVSVWYSRQRRRGVLQLKKTVALFDLPFQVFVSFVAVTVTRPIAKQEK